MEKYTFKKLYKELCKYFGQDNVQFTDSGTVKTIKFGKLVKSTGDDSPIRVYEVNNEWGYNIIKHERYGRFIQRRSDRIQSFSGLANSILRNIDIYIENNNKFPIEEPKMERTSTDDNEELINCLISMKFEGKFDQFYDLIKYYHFDRYSTGISGFNIACDCEEEKRRKFKNKLEYVYRDFEASQKSDFIQEFGIDIIELSDSIMDLMYNQHTDKKYKNITFFTLRSIEEIAKLINC